MPVYPVSGSGVDLSNVAGLSDSGQLSTSIPMIITDKGLVVPSVPPGWSTVTGTSGSVGTLMSILTAATERWVLKAAFISGDVLSKFSLSDDSGKLLWVTAGGTLPFFIDFGWALPFGLVDGDNLNVTKEDITSVVYTVGLLGWIRDANGELTGF
jgi:hypothetical protein